MEFSEEDKGRFFKYLQDTSPLRKFLDVLNIMAFIMVALIGYSSYRYMDDIIQLAFQNKTPELVLEDVTSNIANLSKSMQNYSYLGSITNT